MKKKFLSCVICFCIVSSVVIPMNCLAATSSMVFREYLSNYERIPAQNSYTHNWYMGETISNYGNEGIVASKITDFDSDGSNELLLFLLNWDDSAKINALDFIVVEDNNGYAVEQSRVRLSDDSSCFNKYAWEDMKITFKNNCVGYYYRARIIDGVEVTYKACTYDGNKIKTIVHLFDPGYTDGVGLYNVTNCSKRDYYDNGIELYCEDDYYGCLGIYNSYEDAVNERMIRTGITSYYEEYYGYVGSFENTEILSSLTSCIPNMSGGAPFTSVATFDTYSNALDEISVILNEQELEFDQPPVMIDGRVMVPLRAIFEALGYTVEWYSDTQTAIAHKGNNTITVQINNPEIFYNGKTYSCDIFPQIISGRTLVPVRAISECAGCNVDWDGQTKTVFINADDGIVDIHACIINADADITINDAAMFRQIMLNNKLGNVDENNFHELSEPSETTFKTLISVVSNKADDNDITYFFYSGHGGFSESRGASIVPDYNNQTHNATYDYTMYELLETLSEIPGTVVIILDSCFSGYINENFDCIDTDKFKIITSCKSDEYSWTDNILGLSSFIFNEKVIHGKFTSTLINGLGGYEGNIFNKYNSDVKADYNNDNKVTLSELYKYIYKNMDKSFTINGKKYSQTPTVSDENDQTVIYAY